jgi:hypothetical protein
MATGSWSVVWAQQCCTDTTEWRSARTAQEALEGPTHARTFPAPLERPGGGPIAKSDGTLLPIPSHHIPG